MKELYEVYTVEDNKYKVVFSSEDKDVAYEYLHQHADKDYRMLSLFTYQKINNETKTSTEESKTISKES